MIALIGLAILVPALSLTPLSPSNGYTYVVEAVRTKQWPSCTYRFLSYPSSCDSIDLWSAAGINQQWKLHDTGNGNGSFYLQSSCGAYLSYTADCNDGATIDLWPQAGTNQKFRMTTGDNTGFKYYLEAVGRSQCSARYLSFPTACSTSKPDSVSFSDALSAEQRFRIYPIDSTNPVVHTAGTSFVCPDPFAWLPRSNTSGFLIMCTGGGIKMGSISSIETSSTLVFDYQGDAMGGTPTAWAQITTGDSRWAPENYETPDGKFNYMFFSDEQSSDGKHRLGYVVSETGPSVGAYTSYSPSFLDLGMQPGGEIDSTVFQDVDGRTYLLWKSDDNSVGSTTTHIWMQETVFSNGSLTLLSYPKVIMDSTGLWWIDSWVEGGSLVEGPELINEGEYYYLFFAAGKFCQDSYVEGVARSRSLWGPYEKLGVPVLSNGIVGYGKHSDGSGSAQQLVGPGHASIVYVKPNWKIVWHASIGEECSRYSFVSDLVFGVDGWPYVNM